MGEWENLMIHMGDIIQLEDGQNMVMLGMKNGECTIHIRPDLCGGFLQMLKDI